MEFLEAAVARSGGRVLGSSEPTTAPFMIGVETSAGERIGLAAYAFRSSTGRVRGRDPSEHRVQIRYGGESTWLDEHWLGIDPLGVDVTLVLGIDIARDVIVGLDAGAYDPLPMGISFEYTQDHVAEIRRTGWHVWERANRPGRRRGKARVDGLETVIGLRPDRFLDYVQLERQASALRLDPPLRFRAAEAVAVGGAPDRHDLERQFELSAEEILEIIGARTRLAVAVRGGVAERHLEKAFEADGEVQGVTPIDEDGRPDFEVTVGRRHLTVECKNVSPKLYKSGDYRVEVQKTRATQGDPLGRLYRIDQFDVLAACLWSATGVWEFRYRRTVDLERHAQDENRIAPYQRVDTSWAVELKAAL
jgi:hypothetical protein